MLLGDSIRMGYWQYVKKNLKEIAEAFYCWKKYAG